MAQTLFMLRYRVPNELYTLLLYFGRRFLKQPCTARRTKQASRMSSPCFAMTSTRLASNFTSRREGVEAYAYLDVIAIAADEISPGTRSGALLRERVGNEDHTLKPAQDGCLGPERTRAHAGRYITFGRSGGPHRGRVSDKGGWGTRRH